VVRVSDATAADATAAEPRRRRAPPPTPPPPTPPDADLEPDGVVAQAAEDVADGARKGRPSSPASAARSPTGSATADRGLSPTRHLCGWAALPATTGEGCAGHRHQHHGTTTAHLTRTTTRTPREASMPQYLSPGVYVEESRPSTRPVEGVGTAVAAFVGMATRGPAPHADAGHQLDAVHVQLRGFAEGATSRTRSTATSTTAAVSPTWCASSTTGTARAPSPHGRSS
jgi:hypothetical protein